MIPSIGSGIRLALAFVPWLVWRVRCTARGHDWSPWNLVLWQEFRSCRRCDAFEHRMVRFTEDQS